MESVIIGGLGDNIVVCFFIPFKG